MNLETNSYFRNLAEVISSTRVTNREGEELSLKLGASKAVSLILPDQAFLNKRKIMIVGNGGSAAIASHIHNDLCKAVGVPALVFNEAALLTAMSNDHGYEVAFERCVELWGEPGDLLIAISSSGKSENILRAVRAAFNKSCHIITFSGFSEDNPLRQTGDINFYVPAQTYGFVEVAHMALGHYLSDCAMTLRTEAGKSYDESKRD